MQTQWNCLYEAIPLSIHKLCSEQKKKKTIKDYFYEIKISLFGPAVKVLCGKNQRSGDNLNAIMFKEPQKSITTKTN